MEPLYPYLDSIQFPEDLRRLNQEELGEVCQELRSYILDIVSKNGGHFAANLGTVELTVALHYAFETPKDKLVWDVGHQAYGHKILTGRKNQFHTNRKLGGLSGFPKIEESEYDAFGTGHSSTSISAVMGMAVASELNEEEDRFHIAVIGDGSLTGGMAFEALNNLKGCKGNVLVVLNDNNIGIDPTQGAINEHLATIQNANPNLFENLGIQYHGPIDGHDVDVLREEFERIKEQKGVHLLHIKTVKGKGFEPAEKEQTKWHSTGSFIKLSGEKIASIKKNKKYQVHFGNCLLELAKENENIVAITPAMPTGSSMTIMQKVFPERVFDVDIAEQHAVTFSAGLALEGKTAVCHLYSTFAQRAYDQIVHDVALQNIPVVFCLDRAGNVGEDGPTHHGLYDLAFLNPIPNMIIAAPMDEQELRDMLHTAVSQKTSPFAIRYPKGESTGMKLRDEFTSLEVGKGRCIIKGEHTAILTLGSIGNLAKQVAKECNASHYDMRFMKPLDSNLLSEIASKYSHIITVEDGCKEGGFGQKVGNALMETSYSGKLSILAYPDEIIEHGSIAELHSKYFLDANAIKECVLTKG